jgi:ABC-type glycerol-3-phosphate transport system substrate-binding protein
LKDWYDAGYFNEGFLGLSYADENDLFVTGQTAMVLTGSWINAFYLENSDFEVGLFVLPRVNTDLDWHALINPNNVWIISKYSENQDLAVEFLDYMLGGEVAKARWDQGTLAAYKFDTMPDATSKLQEDCGWAVQNVGGGYSFNANLPGSEAYIFNILQEMVLEDLSAEEVVAGMEENRNELLAGLE